MEGILKTFDLTMIDGIMIPICCLLFFVLWRGLDKFLFSPYLKLFEARELLTTGAVAHSQSLESRANELSHEYEAKMVDARMAAMKLKLELTNKAKLEASAILEKAEQDAKQVVSKAREAIASSAGSANASVGADSSRMIDLIVQKVKEAGAGAK